MRKILFLIITMFNFVNIVNAENFITLDIETNFSENVSKENISSYRVTIKDSDGEFKINVSKEENFAYSFENVLSQVPTISDIAIKNNDGKYGYKYETDSNDERTVLKVYIYDIEKDKIKDGNKVIDEIDVYDPITTTTTTTQMIITKSTVSKSKVTKTENIKNPKNENSMNNFFKIIVIIILGVIIIFVIYSSIKMINANK